jgi:glycine/D-amino acid oxidase-like deaminating enzyme
MKQMIPYWWQDSAPTARDAVPIENACDVVIVGGGYTGLSAAIELARAGKSVQVFDRGVAGVGASSLNGGILSGNLRLGLQAAQKQYGDARGLDMHREAMAARSALSDFITAEKIDCDLAYNGRFTAALKPSDFAVMKKSALHERDVLGLECEVLERSAQHRVIGSDLYHGGILRDDVGSFHPAKFHAGLLRVALEAGVIAHDNTAVIGVHDKYRVQTSRGTVKAAHVIVATNGYGDTSNGWLRKRVVPVTSRIVATDEIDRDVIARLMPRMGTFGEQRYLGRYYRPSPDGKRILLGGRDVLVGANPSGAARRLAQNVAAIFPELDGIGVDTHWAGQVAFTRDEMPSIFENDGIIYACGYCGSGTVWAPWLGRKAAFRILDDERAKSAFDFDAPNAVPLYSGRPWFLPLAIGYYGVRDWMAGR